MKQPRKKHTPEPTSYTIFFVLFSTLIERVVVGVHCLMTFLNGKIATSIMLYGNKRMIMAKVYSTKSLPNSFYQSVL